MVFHLIEKLTFAKVLGTVSLNKTLKLFVFYHKIIIAKSMTYLKCIKFSGSEM